ncbi:uncharacterized protein SAPINGB_P000821 [Magnusiomyces paraingens]|uniref:Acyl carrier protein n=1 Tax=Magnusiomyces paraingens TaxID=2606893 RepID=A0A5E8B8P5_9ASCO|nr:uncharacterized protein SAPINGB_P000821 [Saprochaete ingens]VVT45637.1 unnamed protein product [Saprochaete ingens]
MFRNTTLKSLRRVAVAATPASVRLASTYTLSLACRSSQLNARPQLLSHFQKTASAAATLIPRRMYSAGPPPLTKDSVYDRIVGLLESYDKVADPSAITFETNFSSDLGLDSLDVVEVVLAIEEEFSIEIPDHEADEIKTVGQAVEYILKQPDAL